MQWLTEVHSIAYRDFASAIDLAEYQDCNSLSNKKMNGMLGETAQLWPFLQCSPFLLCSLASCRLAPGARESIIPAVGCSRLTDATTRPMECNSPKTTSGPLAIGTDESLLPPDSAEMPTKRSGNVSAF